jgi:small subunit ribosomal protein S9
VADEVPNSTEEAPVDTEPEEAAMSETAPAAEAPAVAEEPPAVADEAAAVTEAAPAVTEEEPRISAEATEKRARQRVVAGSPPRRGSTGRRKEAVARVRLVDGTGRFELNGRTLEEYFPSRAHRMVITEPLRLLGREKDFDVIARLGGGGVSGQAGALRQGIARALIALDPEYRPELKKEGLLTRDAREKERRKYGLKKARKAPQYSKR